MTSPTSSATSTEDQLQDRQTMAPVPAPTPPEEGAPPPTGPVFRKVWKEVAPGQWQWIHIYDEADQK